MTPKHTPGRGPAWDIRHRQSVPNHANRNRFTAAYLVALKNKDPAAWDHLKAIIAVVEEETAKPSSRLIAAAPELLAALIKLAAADREWNPDKCDAALATAEAAIRRATGEPRP